MAEKTEQPTEQRLREAREQGQVSKSQEIIALTQLTVVLAFFLLKGNALLKAILELFGTTFDYLLAPTNEAYQTIVSGFVDLSINPLGMLLIALIVATIGSFLAQTGFIFSIEALKPNLDKLNPLQNFKNIFSVQSLVEFGKSLLKLLIIGCIFFYLIKQYVMSFQLLPTINLESALPLLTTLIFWLWSTLLASYLVFSLADYAFQRYLWMQKLKMTKQEVMQEYKENEGSPEIKSRRKELHQEIQSGSLSENIKQSSVLVRNPIHHAVGIYYQVGQSTLPMITEIGSGHKARHMVLLAQSYDIPVVESVALARQLVRFGKRGRAVPVFLLEPVALLLRSILIDEQAEDDTRPNHDNRESVIKSAEKMDGVPKQS